jgi:hypothetical protein
LSLDYLRRLIDDVPDDKLAEQPGAAVNHPLWTVGHLIFSAQMLGGEIGLSAWLPDDWASRYGNGSRPTSERSAYPGRNVLSDQLADASRRLAEQLHAVGDEGMREPIPDVRFRETFPTLGHAVVHMLAAHTAAHIGQVVVWRRAMGLPTTAKAFD